MSMIVILALGTLIGMPTEEIRKYRARPRLYRKRRRHFDMEVIS